MSTLVLRLLVEAGAALGHPCATDTVRTQELLSPTAAPGVSGTVTPFLSSCTMKTDVRTASAKNPNPNPVQWDGGNEWGGCGLRVGTARGWCSSATSADAREAAGATVPHQRELSGFYCCSTLDPVLELSSVKGGDTLGLGEAFPIEPILWWVQRCFKKRLQFTGTQPTVGLQLA